MLALERVWGLRVVAEPAALDRAVWTRDELCLVLRFAPDEAFGMRAEHVDVDDPHAIVELEDGFVAGYLSAGELERVREHIEWPLPVDRPALVQGMICGVPAKLWLQEQGDLLLTLAAYADELARRLG